LSQNIDLSKIRFSQTSNLKSQYAAMRDGRSKSRVCVDGYSCRGLAA